MERTERLLAELAQQMVSLMPDAVSTRLMEKAGVDRLTALHAAVDIVRRGGTISISGVYKGMVDPLTMLTLFDKQIQLRMGQANVKRWVDDIMPLLVDEDPLGVSKNLSNAAPGMECEAVHRGPCSTHAK
jgi:threonine dehydrogenase-like Zn-dependent dehydrogenase